MPCNVSGPGMAQLFQMTRGSEQCTLQLTVQAPPYKMAHKRSHSFHLLVVSSCPCTSRLSFSRRTLSPERCWCCCVHIKGYERNPWCCVQALMWAARSRHAPASSRQCTTLCMSWVYTSWKAETQMTGSLWHDSGMIPCMGSASSWQALRVYL